jgi:hypothetical protein
MLALSHLVLQQGVGEAKCLLFSFLKVGVGQTQAWMPTYVTILRIPQMI